MTESDIAALERVIFDRGHGSAWGNQFFTELTAKELVVTRFFDPADPTRTLLTRTNQVLAPEEWPQLTAAIATLLPHLSRNKRFLRLFVRKNFPAASDGTAYRRLTIFFHRGRKLHRFDAALPACPESATLEQLLEQMSLTRFAAESHTNNSKRKV
ncbi:MAG: hypothetical protein E7452_10630 [Ruminococcaceae bacterium]|nr:hypothetical protein [Oscillospiraceae bacterium]